MLTTYELFTESLFNKHKSGKQYTFDEVKNIKFDKEPDNLEDLIKFHIKWYPSLYHGKEARERILIHLYFSSEYGWATNGQIINRVDEDVDDTIIKMRRDEYDTEYYKNDRKERIERLKNEIDMYKDLTPNTYIKTIILRNQKELDKLISYDTIFTPFNDDYDINDANPVEKINFNASVSKINTIPDNAQQDFLNGFLEILSFYSQRRFKNDANYKTILEMKKKLQKRFKL